MEMLDYGVTPQSEGAWPVIYTSPIVYMAINDSGIENLKNEVF